MTRTFLTVIALVAALAAAAPTDAQEATRFFVERIEVRNHSRVSPEVVIYESRLREGAEYTETGLRDAAARLSRLPFLLGAEFALEKGSERGRYTLIITINETRSFFYRLDLIQPLGNIPTADDGPWTRLGGGDQSDAALGFRWFVGRRGALHVALVGRDETEFARGYSAFAVGYTFYDLFGTKAFATVNLKHRPEQSGITPQIVVGMPLSLNQTLTAEYDSYRINYELLFFNEFEDSNDTQKLARLTWSYNTTDHPFVPTEGTLLAAGPLWATRDQEAGVTVVFPDAPPLHTVVRVRSDTVALQGTALRYWQLTDRDSVSAGAEAGFARLRHDERGEYAQDWDRTRNAMYGLVQGGYSRSLWSQERRALGGDSRLELTLRGRLRANEFREARFVSEHDAVQVAFSWLRHSSWGTLRVGAGYAW